MFILSCTKRKRRTAAVNCCSPFLSFYFRPCFFDFPNYYLTQQIEFYRLYDFSGKSKIRSGSVNGLVVLLVLIILLILLVLLIVLLLILVLRVSVLIVVHFRCSPLFCHK